MDSTIRVVSPATGVLLAEVADAGEAGVLDAVARGRAAAGRWAATPLRQRAEALKRFRDGVLDEPRVVETLVSESGKPRHEAEGSDVLYLCELIRFATSAARRALAPETLRPFLFVVKRTRVLRRPLGVVGVIGPWNFPILNNAADCVFPLIAGNAVVLKPSEVTPLTSLVLAEVWRKVGNDPDVFQVVVGRGEAGAALVESADGIMFTGSVATGRRVAERAGRRLIPCVTELGGKSPLIVLQGADLPRAAQAAAWSSFIHSGQACIRTERIYVEEAIAAPFEALLVERVKALRQRAPELGAEASLDLGSLTFARQLEVAERQLEDAVGKGARVLTGGRRPEGGGAGLFFQPTVLGGADHSMEVMREETFGPMVPVMRVKDAEEAVALANTSHLGLSAAVYGPRRKASELARRLEAGMVNVNGVMLHYAIVEAPMGGWKGSGLGLRHGVEGLRQWTRVTAVTEPWAPLAAVDRLLASRLAFPYDPRILRLIRRGTRLLYGRGLRRKLGPLP